MRKEELFGLIVNNKSYFKSIGYSNEDFPQIFKCMENCKVLAIRGNSEHCSSLQTAYKAIGLDSLCSAIGRASFHKRSVACGERLKGGYFIIKYQF